MHCSQRKYEYFCTTSDENFKCVSLEKYFILQYYYLFLYYCYFIIFYFLYCSTDCMNIFVQRVTETSNVFFLKSILFELADGISHVLVDRLTWNLLTGYTFIAWTTDFKIWCFFLFFFFSTQKTKRTRKIDISNSKCYHFLHFRNFAVSVVHAIAIFILIKMQFGFLVSNNQVDRNHVSHSNPFLKTCFT